MERDNSPDQDVISCAPGTVLLEDSMSILGVFKVEKGNAITKTI